MQDIEQRLLSRFKWGLSAELQQPNYETRISILKNKLYRDGVVIEDAIMNTLQKISKVTFVNSKERLFPHRTIFFQQNGHYHRFSERNCRQVR